MRARTLVSRIARVQAAVSTLALVLVAVATLGVVDALLVWKADHHLKSVMDRAAKYLDGAEPESLDWRWFAEEVEEVRPPDVRVEVEDRQGRVRIAAGRGITPLGSHGACVTQGPVRGCTVLYRGFLLRAARDRTDDREVEWQVALALLAACALVGTMVVLGSRSVIRSAVRPLSELSARVVSVEPGSGERLRFQSDLAELDGLAQRFDDLIHRFDLALAREKRFSAEASHELRTPLTVARAELEELLSAEPDPDRIGRAIASVDRLSSLVEALLWFARAQGQLEGERLDVVNVADLVRAEMDLTKRMNPLQKENGRIPDEALVRGDEELLRRAVANLFENAVKHGDGTPIRVSLGRVDDKLKLAVRNGGQAIPGEVRQHIFEPFFRVRRGAQDVQGFGLGLPFAREVARSHGGDLVHEESGDQEVQMLLTLPLVDWNDG